jgi:hypothetical protein
VLSAVDLDDKLMLEADEIDNVTPDRGLPFEFQTSESMRAQSIP